MCHAVREHACLTAACARENQQRTVAVQHRFALRRIERVEIHARMRGGNVTDADQRKKIGVARRALLTFAVAAYDPQKDAVYRRAKREGFRSRAAIKLESSTGCSRCCGGTAHRGPRLLARRLAAGLREQVGPRGRVVGVDVAHTEVERPNVVVLTADVYDASLASRFAGARRSGRLVLSDLAPKLGGIAASDAPPARGTGAAGAGAARAWLGPEASSSRSCSRTPKYQDLIREIGRRFRPWSHKLDTTRRARPSSTFADVAKKSLHPRKLSRTGTTPDHLPSRGPRAGSAPENRSSGVPKSGDRRPFRVTPCAPFSTGIRVAADRGGCRPVPPPPLRHERWTRATCSSWRTTARSPPADPVPLAGKRHARRRTTATTTRIRARRGLRRRGSHVDFAAQLAWPGSHSRRRSGFYGSEYDEIWVHPQGVVSFGAPLSASPVPAQSGQLLAGVLGGPPAVAASGTASAGLERPRPRRVRRPGRRCRHGHLVPTPSTRPAGEANTFRLTLAADGTLDLDYGALATPLGIVGLSPGAGAPASGSPASLPRRRSRRALRRFAWYHDLPQLSEIALALFGVRATARPPVLTAFTTQPVDGPTPVWATVRIPIAASACRSSTTVASSAATPWSTSWSWNDTSASARTIRAEPARRRLCVCTVDARDPRARGPGIGLARLRGAAGRNLAGPTSHWAYVLDTGASFPGRQPDRANDAAAASRPPPRCGRTVPRPLLMMDLATAAEVPPFFVVDDAPLLQAAARTRRVKCSAPVASRGRRPAWGTPRP